MKKLKRWFLFTYYISIYPHTYLFKIVNKFGGSRCGCFSLFFNNHSSSHTSILLYVLISSNTIYYCPLSISISANELLIYFFLFYSETRKMKVRQGRQRVSQWREESAASAMPHLLQLTCLLRFQLMQHFSPQDEILLCSLKYSYFVTLINHRF